MDKKLLRVSYEEMEKQVQERTAEVVQSNISLQAEIKERKRVEKEILEITQKEQRRVGSQLHDGLCQELTGILMFVKGLTQKLESENRLDVAELNKISDLIGSAVRQARNTARGLYPGDMEKSSLMNMLEELTSSTQSSSGVSCKFYCPVPVFVDDSNVATHLYSIAMEGVSNAVKHGDPQSIDVSLTQIDDTLILTIKDDGAGFADPTHNSKGIGLKIMKYRALVIDASFYIEPNLPHGVVLKCVLKGHPCKQ